MNNLEQYRNEKAKELSEEVKKISIQKAKYHAFEEGFDAAIALDLPVKFSKWARDNYSTIELYENHPLDSDKWRECFKSEEITTEKLYQYWIENVYKPE